MWIVDVCVFIGAPGLCIYLFFDLVHDNCKFVAI